MQGDAVATNEKSAHTARAKSNPILATFRLIPFLIVTVYSALRVVVGSLLTRSPESRARVAARSTQYWSRACCRIAGIRIHVIGPLPPAGSLLAPNHSGYADVVALGSAVPTVFVAKADVLAWPFIGLIIKHAGQFAVTRRRSRALAKLNADMQARLRAGGSICVFLEGTSTPGDRLLPFRPALVQPAIDAAAHVIPVAIQWCCAQPNVRVTHDIAYWGDHVLVPHLFRLLGLRGIEAELRFGDPIPTLGMTRWEVIAAAQAAVQRLSGLTPHEFNSRCASEPRPSHCNSP